MNGKQVISGLLLVAGLATAGGLVYAGQGETRANDATTDLAKAKISLAQAISSAEAHAGGRATKAELEGERGVLVFNVEVVTAARKVFEVTIDAVDGKVVASKADTADGSATDAED